jgi:hypothetical protein
MQVLLPPRLINIRSAREATLGINVSEAIVPTAVKALTKRECADPHSHQSWRLPQKISPLT